MLGLDGIAGGLVKGLPDAIDGDALASADVEDAPAALLQGEDVGAGDVADVDVVLALLAIAVLAWCGHD